jgi:hypothetical protein
MPTFPLHSPDFYAGDPYPAYKVLRATSPVCWNDVNKFWALLKYEDVRYVSTNPALFSSAKGITIPDPEQPTLVQENNPIMIDPPRHRQLRKLISSGFTRRQISRLEPKIRELASGILDKIEPGSTYEFAEQIAAPLPRSRLRRSHGRSPAHRPCVKNVVIPRRGTLSGAPNPGARTAGSQRLSTMTARWKSTRTASSSGGFTH